MGRRSILHRPARPWVAGRSLAAVALAAVVWAVAAVSLAAELPPDRITASGTFQPDAPAPVLLTTVPEPVREEPR